MPPPKADPVALCARRLNELGDAPLLVVDVPGADEAERLTAGRVGPLHWFCTHWPTFRALQERGHSASFGPWTEGQGAGAGLVFLSKARERTRMMLTMVASALPPGAPLWLVGARRAGIDSAAPDLDVVAEALHGQSGRHARLWMARVRPGVTACLDEFEEEWALQHGGQSLRIATFPGVFSHRRLDDGTALLLDTVRSVDPPLLDVGCGAGVIGAWYGTRQGIPVHLVDADALAVEAGRRTLTLNGIDGDVGAADVLPEKGDFRTLVSNPPFHHGVETDHRVTETLIDGAARRLPPGGSLNLVCNRFLPVPRLLDVAFGAHEVLADDGRYRVYRALR